jgi:hypothetical protein
VQKIIPDGLNLILITHVCGCRDRTERNSKSYNGWYRSHTIGLRIKRFITCFGHIIDLKLFIVVMRNIICPTRK